VKPEDRFQSLLAAAYEEVANRAPSDSSLLSYFLLDLCRSADIHYTYPSPKHGYHFQAGWHRALQLYLPKCNAPRGLNFFYMVTDERRAKFSDGMLYTLGELEYARTILEHCYSGLARLQERDGDFLAEYSIRFLGIERVENADYKWVVENMPIWYETRTTQHKRWSNIQKQMRKRVYIYRGHFVGYRCTPDIDDYFRQESTLYSRQLIGYDAFPEDATFGGIPFRLYREATQHVVDWALKHQQFTQLLYADNKRKLDMRNLLSLWWREEDLVSDFALLLDLSSVQARSVVDALVLRRADHQFLKGHGLPQPPYVSFGNGWLLRSMAGSLGNPFSFLLRRLKALHESDYRREHLRREGVFRDQLYQVLPSEGLIKVDRPVNLTQGRNVTTDLDGVVLDPRTGTLALIQLKWQDPFGGSMPERRSKQRNLQADCENWLRAVQQWLSDNGYEELFNRLQVRRSQKFTVRRVLYFVLGRFFSQFSGDRKPDGNAAWGNWYQVQRLTKTREMDLADPLGWLHTQLHEDSPFIKAAEISVSEEECIHVGPASLYVRYRSPEEP
jgi:hypothetical protein